MARAVRVWRRRGQMQMRCVARETWRRRRRGGAPCGGNAKHDARQPMRPHVPARPSPADGSGLGPTRGQARTNKVGGNSTASPSKSRHLAQQKTDEAWHRARSIPAVTSHTPGCGLRHHQGSRIRHPMAFNRQHDTSDRPASTLESCPCRTLCRFLRVSFPPAGPADRDWPAN